MKTNKILKCLAILAASIALSLVCIQSSFAKTSGLEFTPLGGTAVDGYINRTNTSFSINFDISDLKPTQTARLMIGDVLLQSYAKPEIELYTMPSSGDIKDFFIAGQNIIHVDILDESGDILKDYLSASVFADFIAPDGTISFGSETGSLELGIGSQINLNFQPDALTDDVQSVMFNFAGNRIAGVLQPDGSYSAQYVIEAEYVIAAEDVSSNNIILFASIADKAGNLTEKIADTTGLIIDTQSPIVILQDPENGKTYNSHDVKISYSVDDNNCTIVLLLNGNEIKVENGQSITGLEDGSYELELMATDKAGNPTKAMARFVVDTAPPMLSMDENPSGLSVKQGETVVFSGTSEPGADILLEVFSDNPQTARTVVGDDGRWRIEFATGDLGVGTHDAYITVSDEFGNSYRVKAASFEIYIPEKIAYVNSTSVVEDVKPKIIDSPKVISPVSQKPQVAEVAKQGAISAAEDTRATGVNWSAWIILLGIVVLASALATAGYYGYAWATTYEQGQKESVKPTQISKLDSKIQSEIEEEKRPESPKDNPPRTRW